MTADDTIAAKIEALSKAIGASAVELSPEVNRLLDELEQSAGQPGIVAGLYRLLDDSFLFDGPLFRFVHVAERANTPTYVAELLNVAPTLILSAPKWASIILMRVLNHQPTRDELVRQLTKAAPHQKASMRRLMDAINAESPDFLARTTPVIVAAEI